MAISKIILNGVTQMDVTQKTVTSDTMLNGTTALKNDGTDITGSITSQAAQTIHPSTSDQTIASGKYLTGTQTIKGVALSNLAAGNIKKDVVVKVGDSADDDCVTSVTGTYEGEDSTLVVTLSWDDNEGMWIPDKTFAEIQAAAQNGKEIVTECDENFEDVQVSGYYLSSAGRYFYIVVSAIEGGYGFVYYMLTDDGLDIDNSWETFFTDEATISSNGQLLNGIKAVGSDGTLYTGNIPTKTSSDLSANGATVTAPAGYYANAATKSVASGTEGTPSATKGTVSNHSVTVTPSVTNSAGYISGGTHNGTAVSVSASELVSGNLPITQNGNNIDVTNYATVSVDVSGSSGMTVGTATATPATASSSISFTVSGEPTSFVITSDSDLATGASPYKVASVVFDGTNVIGQTITNTSNAQVTYNSTGFTKSYSNGTLTVSSTVGNFQANQYTLVYSYGGSSANLGTDDVQVGSGATSITFTNLSDEPDYFSLIFKDNFATSSGYQRVITVVYDGSSTYGLAMDSGAKAVSSWSYTYSNGSLTITSQGTNAGGYFHQPGYYQLTYGYGGEAAPIEVESLSVTSNGTYTAPRGKAYSPVVVNVSGSGTANIGTATMTNSSNQAQSIDFTLPSGRTPKAFFARLTSQIARNSSSRYYYVFDMRWDGSSTGGVAGNTFYMYNGTLSNVTSGYSHSQSNTTFTLSTTGTRSTSPGSFYNGDYELIYVY